MWSDQLEFFLNGELKVLSSPDPEMTILEYIRNEGLTGSKLGCGEGGCGACTVMLSCYNHHTRKIKHRAINACLTPLCSVGGCHIITIEGLGGMKKGLHQIQRRIIELHGSQCGFCTPGIVMALYALFRNHPNATKEFIEENMDGNLCRCTGYRPILDAAKSLASSTSGCCLGKTDSDNCPCQSKLEEENKGVNDQVKKNSNTSKHIFQTTDTIIHNNGNRKPYDPSIDETSSALIFPPQLMLRTPLPCQFVGKYHNNREVRWFQPIDLSTLLTLKNEFQNVAKLVVGNTEIGIETKFKKMRYSVLIAANRIPQLELFEKNENGVFIGASMSLADIEHHFKKLIEERKQEPNLIRPFQAITQILKWFASNQIRNVASIAGNIVTASPISDMNPILSACGAILYVQSQQRGERTIPISEFFLSYRKVDLEPDEILVKIFIPYSKGKFEFIQPYKQAKRREDDISIVCAGIRMALSPNFEQSIWEIIEIHLAFGGLAPTMIQAKKTEEYLLRKGFSQDIMSTAYQILTEEFKLPDNVPGGQAIFRQCLPASFLFKFFVQTCLELQQICNKRNFDVENVNQLEYPNPPLIHPKDHSASVSFLTTPKPTSRGEQSYYISQGGIQKANPIPHELDTSQIKRSPVGDASIHRSAHLHVSGEAIYTSDIQTFKDCLHASIVVSSRVHARIISLDISEALKVVNVVNIFTASNIPGTNKFGIEMIDEELLASEEVHFVGQPIAIVVAKTLKEAEEAKSLVKIEYEDLPSIISIEDAIEAHSFYQYDNKIENGDISKQFDESDIIVEGQVKIGSQEHFYLETHGSIAVPGENDELHIFSSTQFLTQVQMSCSKFLGIPANKITCHVKRIGGGFGGKETRSVLFGGMAAVAAYLTQKPVKLIAERDLDMNISGQRHAFVAYYKAGAKSDGRFKAVDIQLYSNCGFSLDLSAAVMNRALFHVDNCYLWPALCVKGNLCKTNQSSHTAFRGFGAPQAMFVMEHIVDHLAQKLGLNSEELRTLNLYKGGDETYFGQVLDHWNLPITWNELHTSCEFEKRKMLVADYNSKNRWRKRGIVALPTKYGINFGVKVLHQAGSLVHIYTDGTVLISHGGVEMGQGLHTKIIQIAAHTLMIPESSVFISETATDKVVNTISTSASLGTDLFGMATLDACEQLKSRLQPIIDKMPQADFATIAQEAYFNRINLTAQGFYKTSDNRCGYNFQMDTNNNSERGFPFNYFVYGTSCSEVEIDCLTGDARVLRTDIVMDIGSSINPAIDIGQIEGAFIQGLGLYTMEELIWGDKEHQWIREGHLFTRGPGTYKIPAFNDVPIDFRIKILPNLDNPFAVHSSKAIGEPPLFLAASAFFAIKEAIRAARIENGISPHFEFHSPATSERIRMACGDRFIAEILPNVEQYQPNGSW